MDVFVGVELSGFKRLDDMRFAISDIRFSIFGNYVHA